MRPLLAVLGLSAALAAPASAMDNPTAFHMARVELDVGRANGVDRFTWDAEAWVGGEDNRLWLKSEGDGHDGDAEAAEVQALWAHKIAPFWDAQVGVRVDIEPSRRVYLALGVEGLAPYGFETEATLFASERGDISARMRQSFDLRFTQRLVLQPHIEVNAFAQDEPDRDIGAGLVDMEAGLQLRYEITRAIAPYLDVNFARALGETAARTRLAGDDPEETMARVGVRLWF